jgi:hypothetical protein
VKLLLVDGHDFDCCYCRKASLLPVSSNIRLDLIQNVMMRRDEGCLWCIEDSSSTPAPL